MSSDTENINSPQADKTSMAITNLLLVILILLIGFSAFYAKSFINKIQNATDKEAIPTVQIQEAVKQVTTCMSYLVGATSEMKCSGDYNGETDMQELYKNGWHFVSNISGTNKFVMVFEK